MINSSELLSDLKISFPVEPVPQEVIENVSDLNGFAADIRNCFAGKSWPEITEGDWRQIGAPVEVIMHYFKPLSFKYYMPSLISAGMTSGSAIEMVLAATLPYNNRREPRSGWWLEYFALFSERQRLVVKAFLCFAKEASAVGSSNEALAIRAQVVWR